MKIVLLLTTYATLFTFCKFWSTYDSHHDKFHAELLVVTCGGLAVLVNNDFTLLEVSSLQLNMSLLVYNIDFMDIQHLLGVSSHNTPTVYGVKDRRSRQYDVALSVCPELLQSVIYCQLGISLLH